jgi:hypothetical protein
VTPRRRQQVILAALLALLGGSLSWRMLHPFRQERVAKLTHDRRPARNTVPRVAGAPPSAAAEQPTAVLPAAPMEEAQAAPLHRAEVQRDPFWSTPPAPPAAPPGIPGAAPPTPPPDPLLRLREELARFRVFGSWEDAQGMAVFLERDREILLVRRGDLIDGRFRVEQIDRRRMVLRAEQEKETVQIDLDDFYASAYGEMGPTETSGAASAIGGPGPMENPGDLRPPEEPLEPPGEEPSSPEGSGPSRQPPAEPPQAERSLFPGQSAWSPAFQGSAVGGVNR